MGKECMVRLSRRLWGGTSLKTAAKEATLNVEITDFEEPSRKTNIGGEQGTSLLSQLM